MTDFDFIFFSNHSLSFGLFLDLRLCLLILWFCIQIFEVRTFSAPFFQ